MAVAVVVPAGTGGFFRQGLTEFLSQHENAPEKTEDEKLFFAR
jgi:hypothetical protein